MTKKDVIRKVSDATNITQDAVSIVFDGIADTIKKSLSEGETIYIRGLFTLSPVKRAEKKTRDILRKKSVVSPAHYVPHAKFSNELCEEIRKLPIDNNN